MYEEQDDLKPVILSDLDISHPKVKRAVQMARNWQARKHSGHPEASLVLSGSVGVGKTHIAQAIWWSDRYRPDGITVERPMGYFRLANQIIQELDQDIIMSLKINPARGLVVVDDVGSEQTIQFVSTGAQQFERQQRYFKLINYCYGKKISLIITSNLTLDELRKHIGERAWDRLSEMAPKGFMLEMFDVPSHRQKLGGRK